MRNVSAETPLASEDTVESINAVQILSPATRTWTASAIPGDDDAAIPQVVGQTLSPGNTGIEKALAKYSCFAMAFHGRAYVMVVPLTQERSPPQQTGEPFNASRIAALILDRSPAHSIAPPLA